MGQEKFKTLKHQFEKELHGEMFRENSFETFFHGSCHKGEIKYLLQKFIKPYYVQGTNVGTYIY